MIVDSHCHIYDEKMDNIRQNILDSLEKNSQILVCCGDNLTNSQKCVDLASNKNIFAGVGVHPECVEYFSDQTISQLEKMAKDKKVVAIGEIGLDYHYDEEIKKRILEKYNKDVEKINNQIADNENLLIKKEIQEEFFENHEKQKEILKSQIELAYKLDLPCIFHIRDAYGDFLEILKWVDNKLIDKNKDKKPLRAVIHSFSGSVELAQYFVERGFYLGFNGIVTFKNAKKVLEVLKEISTQNILIETDCPYLAPEPYRGQINRPEYVLKVAEKIAEIKKIDIDYVVEITAKNANRLFGFVR